MHNKKACAINYLAESSQAKFLFTIFAHIIIIFALIKKPVFMQNELKKVVSDALPGCFKRRTRATSLLSVIYFTRAKMRHFVNSFVDFWSKKAPNNVKRGENRPLADVFEPFLSILRAKLY